MLTEDARENPLGVEESGAIEALTGEQVSTEPVLDGERIAAPTVPGLEVTFEVRGPDGVGRIEGCRGWTGVLCLPRSTLLVHQAEPDEVMVQGASAGHGPVRVFGEQPSPDDLGADGSAPTLPHPKGLLDHVIRSGVRTGMRPMGAVLEAFGPQLLVAPEPLVGLVPADVVSGGELGDREVAAQPFHNELLTSDHALRLPPRHDDLLVGGSCWVEDCHPSPFSIL